MDIQIVPVTNALLQNFLQYFIFSKVAEDDTITYTSFPNTNLCLSIYKQGSVSYCKTDKINKVNLFPRPGYFNSHLYGFHKRPLEVKMKGPIEQVCILFQPGGLAHFTKTQYQELLNEDHVFNHIFEENNSFFLEEIFDHTDMNHRAGLLEAFLLKRIKNQQPSLQTQYIIQLIKSANGNRTIKDIAAKLHIHSSTLFRSFLQQTGYAPKHFAATVRFRSALDLLLKNKAPLTSIGYDLDYYDQTHFIKDIKRFSGYTPLKLKSKVSVVEEKLVLLSKRK
jgi:AraC-like DNA-binding protein